MKKYLTKKLIVSLAVLALFTGIFKASAYIYNPTGSGGGGGGTVTSVGLTVPSGFTVSGSPVTSSGNLGVTYIGGNGILQSIGGAISSLTQPANNEIWYTSNTGALTGDMNALRDSVDNETELQRTDGTATTGMYTVKALPVLSVLLGQNVSGNSLDYIDGTANQYATIADFLNPASNTPGGNITVGDANGQSGMNIAYDTGNQVWQSTIGSGDSNGNSISHLTIRNGPGPVGTMVDEMEYSPVPETQFAGVYNEDDGNGNPLSYIQYTNNSTSAVNKFMVSKDGVTVTSPQNFIFQDNNGNDYINVDSSSVGAVVNLGDDDYAHNSTFSGVLSVDNATNSYGVLNFLQQQGANSYLSVNGENSGGEFTYGQGDLKDAHFGTSIEENDSGSTTGPSSDPTAFDPGLNITTRDINIGSYGSPVDYVFPSFQASAAGDVLTNNGLGVLTWASPASSLSFPDSVTESGGSITLVNDTSSPSSSSYYGTNGSGTLGYFSLASFGLIGSTSGISNNPTPGASDETWLGENAGGSGAAKSENVFLGENAGKSDTGTSSSVFAGNDAGNGATFATQAIFIGDSAGLNDTVHDTETDASNIAIGMSSGTGGFMKTIALGRLAVNTASNQFLIQSAITQFDMRGINWTMPAAQGAANTALTNDGSGNLTWTNGQLPHQIFSVTPTLGACGTTDITDNTYNILDMSGACTTLTVGLPATPSNNDTVEIKFTDAVTTLSFSGGTVGGAITSQVVGGYTKLVFDTGTSTWY